VTDGDAPDEVPDRTLATSRPRRGDEVVRSGAACSAAGTGDTSGYDGPGPHDRDAGAVERPFGGEFDDVADSRSPAGRRELRRGAVEKLSSTAASHLLRRRERSSRAGPARRPDLRSSCSPRQRRALPARPGRELHAVYHLLSVTHNRRVRLEVTAPDADPHIPSVVEIYPTADWHERETWDFFGIVFDGHPALTRIEMPDDWPGHPQRKDYPLGGIDVEYKGAVIHPPETRRSYS
jgi:NADH-quinone oxidoreductase subunit C